MTDEEVLEKMILDVFNQRPKAISLEKYKYIHDKLYDRFRSRYDAIYWLVYKHPSYFGSNSLDEILEKAENCDIILFLKAMNRYMLFHNIEEYIIFSKDYISKLESNENDKFDCS